MGMPKEMFYLDWLAVSLTAVTVLLALAAVLFGGVAIFGYGRIKRKATESAQKVAREEMTKYLKESNIRKMLEEHVRKVSDGLYADMAQSPGHDIEENPEKRAP